MNVVVLMYKQTHRAKQAMSTSLINFRIAAREPWVNLYCSTDSVQCVIDRLSDSARRVRNAQCGNRGGQTRVASALAYLRFQFTADVCIGEGLATFGPNDVETLVTTAPRNLSTLTCPERAGYNVYHALPFVLDQATPFSLENICELHARIGQGIIANAGRFRTVGSAPLGSTRQYKVPEAIEGSLRDLVDSVNTLCLDNTATDEDTIKIASAFYAAFLMIHPFSDGNGRVARLCLSWLLKDRFVVPVSLAVGGLDGRQIVLQCLESTETWDGKPSQLARYVLNCASDTAVSVAFAADV